MSILNKTTPAIRLLISDIDGTLIPNNKIVTNETIHAIHKMKQEGIGLSLVSSRPALGMRLYLEQLKIELPFAALNGGEILDVKGNILSRICMNPVLILDICNMLQKHKIEIWLYSSLEWFVFTTESAFVEHEQKVLQLQPKIIQNIQDHVTDTIKIMGISQDTVLLDNLAQQIKRRHGREVSAVHSSKNYLDISHLKANKGFAAQKIAELLKIPLSKTACIGDMDNDIPMLKIAGMPIVMGQSSQRVKQYAHHIARTNEENGWAYAVNQFLL